MAEVFEDWLFVLKGKGCKSGWNTYWWLRLDGWKQHWSSSNSTEQMHLGLLEVHKERFTKTIELSSDSLLHGVSKFFILSLLLLRKVFHC